MWLPSVRISEDLDGIHSILKVKKNKLSFLGFSRIELFGVLVEKIVLYFLTLSCLVEKLFRGHSEEFRCTSSRE